MFVNYLKEKYPTLDVDKFLKIFEEKMDNFKKENLAIAEDERFKVMISKINTDLNKNIIASVIEEYLKTKEN